VQVKGGAGGQQTSAAAVVQPGGAAAGGMLNPNLVRSLTNDMAFAIR
jgi:hypothetical protein